MARALVALGISALIVLVIVLITGGFTLAALPLHLSAHNPRGPALIAIFAFVAAGALNRAAFHDALAASWTFLDQHAPALAIVIASAAAGAGVAYGTGAASSADASGYVSESRLIASGQLATDEPLARAVAWPNATWAFSPFGYRPGSEPGELVPTYPAGLPLAMASVRLIAGELAVYFVVPLLGAIGVLATYGVGARLHSRIAGLIAAFLLATSPIVLFQIVQPMSDVPVTAWWAVALLFALLPLPGAPLAAGAASGLAILTRPNLMPLALVVALAAANIPRLRRTDYDAASARQAAPLERRRRLDRLIPFAAGITPAVGAQFLMQWRLYGSPLASGYGSAGDLYALHTIVPNAIGYTRRLMHGEGPALALGIAALIILTVIRRRAADTPPLERPIVLAAIAFGIVAASYLPYATFAEWSYLRFLLPAFPLLFVVSGALLVNAVLRLPPQARATTLLCVLAIAGSFNVVRAQGEQAFAMQRYESRYRFAGRYLAAALPSNGVIVTVQESGSARYYTNLPIVRWDQLDVDLDTAIAALRALRRHPVLLVEDWEAPQLAKKYPRSVTARLDWQPTAEFGEETRVFLYDPSDGDSHRRFRADRVH